MQKVVYLVSKVNKDKKLKGVGYLVEGNLLIPSTSSKGNPYIRIFDDITKHCHPIDKDKTEYKGYVTLAYENVNIFNKEKDRYETLDYVETTFYVWFKLVKKGGKKNEYLRFLHIKRSVRRQMRRHRSPLLCF